MRGRRILMVRALGAWRLRSKSLYEIGYDQHLTPRKGPLVDSADPCLNPMTRGWFVVEGSVYGALSLGTDPWPPQAPLPGDSPEAYAPRTNPWISQTDPSASHGAGATSGTGGTWALTES